MHVTSSLLLIQQILSNFHMGPIYKMSVLQPKSPTYWILYMGFPPTNFNNLLMQCPWWLQTRLMIVIVMFHFLQVPYQLMLHLICYTIIFVSTRSSHTFRNTFFSNHYGWFYKMHMDIYFLCNIILKIKKPLESFNNFAHTQFYAYVKVIKVGNSSEFLSMRNFLQFHGIKYQRTCV